MAPKQVQLQSEALEKQVVAHIDHVAAHDDHSLAEATTRATDPEKGSVHSHGAEGQAYRAGLARAERKLLLKLDLGILPFAVLLYLSAYLDRGNL